MKSLYVNLFEPSARALLEDCAAGDESLELTTLCEEDRLVLLALTTATESYRLSKALGALFMAGVKHGHRQTRRLTPT